MLQRHVFVASSRGVVERDEESLLEFFSDDHAYLG
jgi:hypothetical protein